MNTDIGLLGFLQKKSLLGNDSSRVQLRKRSNSRSKGDKDSIIKKINERDFDERTLQQSTTPQRKNQQKQFSPKDRIYYQRQNTFQHFNSNQSRFAQPFNMVPHQNVQPIQNIQNKNNGSLSRTYDKYFEQQSNIQGSNLSNSNSKIYNQQPNSNQLQSIANRTFQTYNNPNKNLSQTGNIPNVQIQTFKGRHFEGIESPLKRSIQKPFHSNNSNIVEDQKTNNIWGSKIVPQPVGFQSARLESAQCLDTLSLKLKTSISNINFQIDKFRSNMGYALNHHMRDLREKILEVVDEVFRQSQKQIKQYMKYEEQRLAGELVHIRNTLQDQYVRIQGMKEDLNRPQWRKVAGQILTTQIEKNIEILLKQSSETQIHRWEKISTSDQQINSLRIVLRDLTRLKQ